MLKKPPAVGDMLSLHASLWKCRRCVSRRCPARWLLWLDESIPVQCLDLVLVAMRLGTHLAEAAAMRCYAVWLACALHLSCHPRPVGIMRGDGGHRQALCTWRYVVNAL